MKNEITIITEPTLTEKIQELETKIKTIKAGRTLKALKSEDKKGYYKVQNMTWKLGWLKAEANGNLITEEHFKVARLFTAEAFNK